MSIKRLIPILLLLTLVAGSALAEKHDWPTKRSSDTEWGEDLYNKHCWQCHGRKGEGDGPAADALQVEVPVLRGISDPSNRGDMVTTARQGHGAMPAYHESISRQDMRRVFLYLESPDKKAKKKADEEDEEEEPEAPTEEGNAPDVEGGD
jgi:mono/diheme cytochrome c family protein